MVNHPSKGRCAFIIVTSIVIIAAEASSTSSFPFYKYFHSLSCRSLCFQYGIAHRFDHYRYRYRYRCLWLSDWSPHFIPNLSFFLSVKIGMSLFPNTTCISIEKPIITQPKKPFGSSKIENNSITQKNWAIIAWDFVLVHSRLFIIIEAYSFFLLFFFRFIPLTNLSNTKTFSNYTHVAMPHTFAKNYPFRQKNQRRNNTIIKLLKKADNWNQTLAERKKNTVRTLTTHEKEEEEQQNRRKNTQRNWRTAKTKIELNRTRAAFGC